MAVCRKRYSLSGNVQGVGFRYFAHRVARELGVHGWVRNLPDGRVEIEAQGEEEKLNHFLLKIKSGPPLAVIRDISIENCEALAPYERFTIEF
ncbi:MAG: acylphosphatase [Acidobacteria bacterium]|nr:acylphosphatase [Acidobacteriota bacterium]